MNMPPRVWIEHHGGDGMLSDGDGEVYLTPRPEWVKLEVGEYIRADLVAELWAASIDILEYLDGETRIDAASFREAISAMRGGK